MKDDIASVDSKSKNSETIKDNVSYDEIKYIDEWISYMKDCNYSKQTVTSSEQDEESSFSSLMNFYLSSENKYLESTDDLKNEIVNHRELKLIKCDEMSSDNESIDLCQKGNLVDSDLKLSNSEEETSRPIENSIKIDEIESRPFKVQITRIETPIPIIKPNYKKSLINNYYNEEALSNQTFGLISQAKNRTIQQNKRSESDIPLRKFVIETEESIINIKDILKFSDMKNKIIVGKVKKMSSKGYFTENWISLRESFMSCYNSKSHKKSSTCLMNEKNGDLEHPEDPTCFLTKKYTIDLLSSQVFICKNKKKGGLLSCYSISNPDEDDLVDLSDKIIVDIKKSIKGYIFYLKKDSKILEVPAETLNFQIKTVDGYRFFTIDDLTEYIAWNVIYRFRINQIFLNIG